MPRRYNMTDDEFFDWFNQQLIPSENGCLIWKNATQKSRGYGWLWYKGRPMLANRLALQMKLKKDLADNIFACHTCNNPPCCNPEHLKEGTNQENMDYKVSSGRQSRLKGEENPDSVLTTEQVIEIRALQDLFSKRELSEMFSVSSVTIANIIKRKSWKHID